MEGQQTDNGVESRQRAHADTTQDSQECMDELCHVRVFSPTLNGVALRLPRGRLGVFQPELGALRYQATRL